MIHAEILQYFNDVFIDILNKYGNDTTYSFQLDIIGKKLLGNKFIGVYASDKIPYNIIDKYNICYFIVNTDNSDGIGKHWIAIGKDKNDIYYYDTYGRDKDILSKEFRKNNWLQTNPNIEQSYITKVCGQKCIAWLVTCDKYGIKRVAKYI